MSPVPTRATRPLPRVLITGIGLNTGLGEDRESSWARLRAGRHGFTPYEHPHWKVSPAHFGCRVRGGCEIDVARSAFFDAGLPGADFPRDRAGVVFGLSKGRLGRLIRVHKTCREVDPESSADGLSGILDAWPHAAASQISSAFGLGGPSLGPVAACATGLIAALRGAELIQRGECDVVLAGAADTSLDLFVLEAFRRMGVLARVGAGEDPGRAVRPWDRDRSGFLVGEGMAAFVLEREDHARARGILPYAEFCGGTFGADAYHMTNLNPDPSNLAGLIGRALENAGVEPSEVDHVNVHGTATKANDPLECLALRLVFGAHADRLTCSANKAQIGHLLGAAGAVELAFTALAVRDGFVPPTRNLDHPDPRCDLDGTPHVGRVLPIRAALKLSIGFGGHLAAAVLRRADAPRREPI